MVYSNLLYLLIVIFALSAAATPATPQLPLSLAAAIFTAKTMLYIGLVRFVNGRGIRRSADYFSTEMRFSILAIVSLAADIYLLDCKFYFAKLPFVGQLPMLADVLGVGLFLVYLSIMWLGGRVNYLRVFGGGHGRWAFVKSNLKINISIILPWLLVTAFSDLLRLTPLPFVDGFLDSAWGEPVLVLIFFLLLAIWFPVLLVRLWGCKPMPAGPVRERIEKFCRGQNMAYAEIMVWPLFEGKMITAGVMGLVRRFRYLLITPALLQNTDGEELDAVLAHEIGHVKRHHLQLYILLFLGFGVLMMLSSRPLLYLLLKTNVFYSAMLLSDQAPSAILTFITNVPVFLFMLIYFRFIFGFFMRNFERQADLHAVAATGSAEPLSRVLEKIAILSGDIRDQPSWHHFGISQRVDFLTAVVRNKKVAAAHHFKVYASLLVYIAVIIGGLLAYTYMPTDILGRAPEEKFAEAVIARNIKEEPRNPLWYQFMGDLQLGRKHYAAAINAYEKNLALMPDNPEVLNNLAWLLLSARDRSFRDPEKALEYALRAVAVQPRGFILDTLAEAYWFNDMTAKAVATERRAIALDPANRDYYLQQIKKFNSSGWSIF